MIWRLRPICTQKPFPREVAALPTPCGLNKPSRTSRAPSATRTAKLPRCLRGRDRVAAALPARGAGRSPPLVLAVLGVLGTGVDGRLSPTSLDIPGTALLAGQRASCASTSATRRRSRSSCAARRRRSTARGPSWSAPCAPATRRSPPSRPGTAARSGACGPSPRQALIVADFHVGLADAVNDSVDELNAILDEQIHPPVQATQTGYATLSRAIQDESIAAAERSELIALPILLLVLLLVFRSPIAAAIPLVFGAVTVASLARPALHPHRLVRHRRLRAHRLHDDGPGARASTTPC